MSPNTSTNSWSSNNKAVPDIIDLDRYMRNGISPQSRHRSDDNDSDHLIVDAGAVARKPRVRPAPAPASSSSESVDRTPPKAPKGKQAKRFSHDSGVSDESYTKKKHRSHRQLSYDGMVKRRVEQQSARLSNNSHNSLKEFRAVCEKTLREQQEQIARVAQICEKLTETTIERPPPPKRVAKTEESNSIDSSDVSSSTLSSKDPRMKDKKRTESCKTYKIISRKLDELTQLFGTRTTTSPTFIRRPARALSSGSVSVSDKLVATEQTRHSMITVLRPTQNVIKPPTIQVERVCVVERGVGAGDNPSEDTKITRDSRLSTNRGETTYIEANNNSLKRCDFSGEELTSSINNNQHCIYGLDNPVNLYTEAKQLQTTTQASVRTSRRARSADCSRSSRRRFEDRDVTLCALCRTYWRSIRQYVATQIFCCPEHTCVHSS